MTTTDTPAPRMPAHIHNRVEHDLQMSTQSQRHLFARQRIAVLALRWNPYGAGIFGTPSSGIAKAPRAEAGTTVAPLTPFAHVGAITDEVTYVECYDGEIAAITAQVETEMDQVQRSFRSYERMVREKIKNAIGREPPENRAHWTDEMRAIESKIPALDNPAARFHSDARRGILPLLSVDVIASGLDLPLTHDEHRIKALVDARNNGQTSAADVIGMLAVELRKLQAAPPQDTEEAEKLRKANEGMAAKIKTLEARLADTKKSG